MAIISNFPSGGGGARVPPVEQMWSFTGHTDTVRSVAVDTQFNVYSGSYDKTVRKINSSGQQVWSYTGHTSVVNGVAVDASGNIYSGSSDCTIRKINSNGTQAWSFTAGGGIMDVAVDTIGNVYSGGIDNNVRKINSSGAQVWIFGGRARMSRAPEPTTSCVNAVAVDASGNVYSGGDNNPVRKINSAGTQVWRFTGHADAVLAVTVDASGNVYSGGGGLGSIDHTVRKINSSGTQVWSYTGHTSDVNGVAVDASGNIYSGSSDCTIRKINSNGTQAWSFTAGGGVADVVVDTQGNVYSGNYDDTVIKISQPLGVLTFRKNEELPSPLTVYKMVDSGDPPWERWSFTVETGTVGVMAADVLGNVIINAGSEYLQKIDSGGKEVLRIPLDGILPTFISIDESENILIGSESEAVIKFDKYGRKLWSTILAGGPLCTAYAINNQGLLYTAREDGFLYAIDTLGTINIADSDFDWKFALAMYVDSSNNIYCSRTDSSLTKIDKDFHWVWEYIDAQYDIGSMIVDNNENIYCGTPRSIMQIDSNGEQGWNIDGVFEDTSFAIDETGYLYSGSSDMSTMKINPVTGDTKWELWGPGHENSSAIAVDHFNHLFRADGYGAVRKLKQVYKIY